MNKFHPQADCNYDYAIRCDCAEDDNCGCSYPNNIPHDFTADCFEKTQTNTLLSETISHPLTIGMIAPDFTAPAVFNNETIIEHFNFYKYINNKLAVLFFYPEDFTFTCPSELLMLNKELASFEQRGARVIAISTDSVQSHLSWKQLPPEKDGIPDIKFLLVSDENKQITQSYGFLAKKQVPMRATVIIDNQKVIRHISLNDNKIWRNPTEPLRILDILNYRSENLTNCPPGWKQNFFFERPEPETLTEMFSHRNEY